MTKKRKDNEDKNNDKNKEKVNGELHKIIKINFFDKNKKDEKEIWASIVEAYNKKYNTNLPTDIRQMTEIMQDHKRYDAFFAKSIKIAIMEIIAGIIDIIRSAITRINEVGLENLDEKEMIIVIEKMSVQIKLLVDLYQKMFKQKEEDDDEGSGFDVKVL